MGKQGDHIKRLRGEEEEDYPELPASLRLKENFNGQRKPTCLRLQVLIKPEMLDVKPCRSERHTPSAIRFHENFGGVRKPTELRLQNLFKASSLNIVVH